MRDDSLRIAEQIAIHCQAKGISSSQFALAWCLANPVLSSVIIGPRTEEQFDDNMKCLNIQITDNDESFVDSLVPPGEHSGEDSRIRPIRLQDAHEHNHNEYSALSDLDFVVARLES